MKNTNKSITEETIIEKFQKTDLSSFPDVHSYTTKAEPIMWVLWVIKNQFKITAYIPTGMLANIMADGIGKSADQQLIKNRLAHAIGTKVHRKIEDGQPVYKIMEEGIRHLQSLEKKSKREKFEKIYKSGQQYNVYQDLRNILSKAKKQVFIIDAYPDVSLYHLYVDSIPSHVPIKILTNHPPQNFITVGTMLSQQRNLRIQNSPHVHDRYIFVDDKSWMIGSSIKDAAKKKPTTLVKLEGTKELYSLWNSYFKLGSKLI